jgi:hypothetical protein
LTGAFRTVVFLAGLFDAVPEAVCADEITGRPTAETAANTQISRSVLKKSRVLVTGKPLRDSLLQCVGILADKL